MDFIRDAGRAAERAGNNAIDTVRNADGGSAERTIGDIIGIAKDKVDEITGSPNAAKSVEAQLSSMIADLSKSKKEGNAPAAVSTPLFWADPNNKRTIKYNQNKQWTVTAKTNAAYFQTVFIDVVVGGVIMRSTIFKGQGEGDAEMKVEDGSNKWSFYLASADTRNADINIEFWVSNTIDGPLRKSQAIAGTNDNSTIVSKSEDVPSGGDNDQNDAVVYIKTN